MDTAPSTRYSLVLRIQDPQNNAAWAEFVAIYEPIIYHFVCRQGLQHADACDLSQEVFRRVAGAARQWQPDEARGTFRSWLFRISKNLIIDFLRQQQRQLGRASGDSAVQRTLEGQPAQTDASTSIELEYRRHLFQLAGRSIQQEFSPDTWQAFWKTTIESQSITSVAAQQNMTTGAVYIARSRVLARLRQRVKEIEGSVP